MFFSHVKWVKNAALQGCRANQMWSLLSTAPGHHNSTVTGGNHCSGSLESPLDLFLGIGLQCFLIEHISRVCALLWTAQPLVSILAFLTETWRDSLPTAASKATWTAGTSPAFGPVQRVGRNGWSLLWRHRGCQDLEGGLGGRGWPAGREW